MSATSTAVSRFGPIGLRRGRVMGSFAHVIDAALSAHAFRFGRSTCTCPAS